MFDTLDVGCGNNTRAEVNIDYRTFDNIEINQRTLINVNIKEIPNFIHADGLHLPFRDKAFRKTFCHHVIEHVANPHQLIREMVRVTEEKLEIRCPHRFSKDAKCPYHKHYFTREWFAEIFEAHKFEIETAVWYPFRLFGIVVLPHEIRITVNLKSR